MRSWKTRCVEATRHGNELDRQLTLMRDLLENSQRARRAADFALAAAQKEITEIRHMEAVECDRADKAESALRIVLRTLADM